MPAIKNMCLQRNEAVEKLAIYHTRLFFAFQLIALLPRPGLCV